MSQQTSPAHALFPFDGALLVDKHAGISSFGVIEQMQRALLEAGRTRLPALRRRELPSMGHGGTLDPFATGLLAVCVGRGVKLARYFLGSRKTYEGVIRFGQATASGDPTDPVNERSDVLPASLEALREAARSFTLQPYLQTPPMHSAKKIGGQVLYELARKGLEVEREPKRMTIFSFEILAYEAPLATFRTECSAGTYVRTLAQDLAAKLGTIAMLDKLHRTGSGIHTLRSAGGAEGPRAVSTAEIAEATAAGIPWDRLPAWVPFDRLLDGYDRADATPDEALALFQGRQSVLPRILERVRPGLAADRLAKPLPPRPGDAAPPVAVYQGDSLIAMARMDHGAWGLERVFVPGQG